MIGIGRYFLPGIFLQVAGSMQRLSHRTVEMTVSMFLHLMKTAAHLAKPVSTRFPVMFASHLCSFRNLKEQNRKLFEQNVLSKLSDTKIRFDDV